MIDSSLHAAAVPHTRNVWTAMSRGARMSCPSCGKPTLFDRYLKVAHECSSCGEELHHHRADDAPPYFTIFIVGHIVVPFALWAERLWQPEMWIHMALWLPMVVILTLLLLPVVKGVIVGLQWALYMHGFELASERGTATAHSGVVIRTPQNTE